MHRGQVFTFAFFEKGVRKKGSVPNTEASFNQAKEACLSESSAKTTCQALPLMIP